MTYCKFTEKGLTRAESCALKKLVVIARRLPQDKIEKCVEAVIEGGVRFIESTFDQSDPDCIHAVFEKVKANFGRIDSLVANAADPGYNQSILSTTPEQYDHVMNSNARGYFFCCQEAAKLMIEGGRGGSIVLIGSVHSKGAIPNRITYASSKGAIDVMNRNMCYELGKFGIRSNVIIVGAVYNDRWVDYTPEDYEKKRANWPVGIESYPEDIANSAYFLCSDQAKTISGSELTVDSGVMSVLLSYNKNWDAEKDAREKLVK